MGTSISSISIYREVKNLSRGAAMPELGLEPRQFGFRIHALNH